MDIEQVFEIAAPAEHVWAVLSDVGRWPEWTASMSTVELLDTPPFTTGSRIRIRQPRLPVATWTITALEEHRYFEWRNDAAGLRSVAGHRIEPLESERVRVTLTFGWSGWLAPLVRLIYGGRARRYVAIEAEGLKRRCEAGGGPMTGSK